MTDNHFTRKERALMPDSGKAKVMILCCVRQFIGLTNSSNSFQYLC